MEPDADTASATVPRSTVTVGGPALVARLAADGHEADRHDEDHGDRDEQEPLPVGAASVVATVPGS